MATARVEPDVYRLDLFSDPLCGIAEFDQRLIEAVDRQIERLSEWCASVRLDGRAGVLPESQ